ncbi:MAG: hypothetical protein HWN81_14935 [Candidatus Lokiarchaeota archaeon]|nr:hypothetical protein [Candidatus Lokiarchaeota archaeon]
MERIKIIIKAILWPATILNGFVVLYKVPENWLEAQPMLEFLLNDWVRIFQFLVFVCILLWLVWPLIISKKAKLEKKRIKENSVKLIKEDSVFLKFKNSIFSNIEIKENEVYFKNPIHIDLNHHTGCGILALQKVKLDYIPIKAKTTKIVTNCYHHVFSGFKVIIKQNTKEIKLEDFGEFEIVLSDDYDIKTSTSYQYFEFKIEIIDNELKERISEENFGLSTLLNMKIKSIKYDDS